ncbi:MAG: TonB-dependent receptor, partial [Steroidobacteraceae bacterium]
VVAKYQPDDSLTFTPSVGFQRQHQNDTPVFYLSAGLYNESNVVAEPATDEDMISSITIDKHFGLGDLTSISSYFSRNFGRKLDGTYFDPYYVTHFILDYNPLTEAEASIANDTLALLPTTVHVTDKTTSFTQEVRLSSPTSTGEDRELNWLIGAVFSNTVDHWRDYETAPGWNALFQSVYGYSPNDPTLSPVADPADPTAWEDDFVLHTQRYGYSQVGGFGQAEYKILAKLTATAGLRYQVTELTYSYNGKGFYNIGIPNVNDDHVTDSATTPKFSLTYSLTPTAKLYATAAKGYRDGGYNSPNPAGVCGSFETSAYRRSFRPDELWSYEAGFKGLFSDRNLSINADGYELRWSQTQQPITIPVCGWSYTTNVGSAVAYGSEIELLYRASFVEGLTLGANGGTEHAYVTSAGANSPTQVGENLLYAPRWTATATVAYTRPIRSDLSLSIGADSYWQGKSYGDFQTTATDYINKPYSVLNARVSVLTEHGLEVGLFAKNLLDNTTIIRSPSLAFVTEAYTVPPRMIGIQIKQQF